MLHINHAGHPSEHPPVLACSRVLSGHSSHSCHSVPVVERAQLHCDQISLVSYVNVWLHIVIGIYVHICMDAFVHTPTYPTYQQHAPHLNTHINTYTRKHTRTHVFTHKHTHMRIKIHTLHSYMTVMLIKFTSPRPINIFHPNNRCKLVYYWPAVDCAVYVIFQSPSWESVQTVHKYMYII